MREMENCAAWGFVNAATFHSNKTVLDDIDATDAVLSAELVQRLHYAERRHGGRRAVGAHFLGHASACPSRNANAIAGFKRKIDMFGFVGRIFGGDAEFVHPPHLF